MLKINGNSLRYGSDELKNDKEIVLEASEENGMWLKHAIRELRN
jgi:hypothetical protein